MVPGGGQASVVPVAGNAKDTGVQSLDYKHRRKWSTISPSSRGGERDRLILKVRKCLRTAHDRARLLVDQMESVML